jgi:hypothetical protein
MNKDYKRYKLFYFSFVIFPIIDAINGFSVLSGLQGEGSAGTFGQLSKGIFVLFGLILMKRYSGLVIVSLLIGYVLALELLALGLHNNFSFFTVGISHSLKLLFPVILLYLMIDIKNNYGLEVLIPPIIYSTLFYALILLITYYFGIGFSTYDEGAFGFKGPFASGNGLALYLGSMSLFGLYCFKKTNDIYFLCASVVIIIAALIVGTKASLLFLIVYIFCILTILNKIYSIFIILSSIVYAVFYLGSIINAFFMIFDVIVYRFDQSSSIFEFFASGRGGYVSDAFEALNIDGLYSLRLLFGMGSFISFRNIDDLDSFDTLETDFFDIFFFYGAAGLLLYIAFFILTAIKILKYRNYFLGLIFLLVFSYSAIAGHVLFNSMSVVALVFFHFFATSKFNLSLSRA